MSFNFKFGKFGSNPMNGFDNSDDEFDYEFADEFDFDDYDDEDIGRDDFEI